MLEDWFPCTSHIREHRLPKMPSQELVGHTVRICRIAADGIENPTIQAQDIVVKYHNLVVILFELV